MDRPDVQARGLGRELLDAAMATAQGTRGQIILSFVDPRALRRYARAGFALRPALDAAGIVDRSAIPAVQGVTPSDDPERTARVSRIVRGASHHVDVAAMLEAGDRLLVHDCGFAVHLDGSVRLLAALGDEAAQALLSACLVEAIPGAEVHLELLSEGQDWAVAVALDARLALRAGEGAIFTRGQLGPSRPYVPSGPYL